MPPPLQRILQVRYSLPEHLQLSPECQDLLQQIFVADPVERVTIDAIKRHPWFLTNMQPHLLLPDLQKAEVESQQSVEDIHRIMSMARTPPARAVQPAVGKWPKRVPAAAIHSACCMPKAAPRGRPNA